MGEEKEGGERYERREGGIEGRERRKVFFVPFPPPLPSNTAEGGLHQVRTGAEGVGKDWGLG